MLIEFIGCPSSGKTTIAAKLFARLKEAELPAEFIGEQARYYIAKKRLENPKVVLTDLDQQKISREQYEIESVFTRVCPAYTYIVCDSSPLNSKLYISDTENYRVLADSTAIRFFCSFVDFNPSVPDTNRVHSTEQIRALNEKVKALSLTCPQENTIWLYGSLQDKVNLAFNTVIGRSYT